MDCQEQTCSLNLRRKAINRFYSLLSRSMPASVIAVLVCCFLLTGVSVGESERQEPQPQIGRLIEQLYEVDFDQRELAERQLIEIGAPAIDLLLEELIDCKPDVCSRVKRILQACSEKCDEESLFKVLAVLRLRFNVPDQRVKPMLERWASQRRSAVVAAWREQGAVVVDPFQGMGRDGAANVLVNGLRLQMAPGRQVFELKIGDGGRIASGSKPAKVKVRKSPVSTRSIAEVVRLVLEGTLEQNKQLVLNSSQGADGFEEKMAMVQKQPVTVTIGEDWKGDYSVFDFEEATSILPISNLYLKNLEVTDALLSVLKEHPLGTVVLTECSVASDLKEALPPKLRMLTIRGATDLADVLRVVASGDSELSHIRFEKCKFGEMEALLLRDFRQLASVDLIKIDLESDTFDGLTALRQLRRLWLERCKFPAAAFIDFQQKRRRDVNIDFKAKAFLGVSSSPPRGLANQIRERRPAQRLGACLIATVVEGEAADRAGVKVGDEIVKIGDQEIKSFDELRLVIAQYEIGEEAVIQVLRGGKELTLKAKMGEPND